MKILLVDRTHECGPIAYENPLSINIDRAGDIYSAADIAGNDLQPDDMLLCIQLPGNEQATFTAARWTILPVPEAIA